MLLLQPHRLAAQAKGSIKGTAASATRQFALGQLEGLGYGLLSTLAENPGATLADLVHASEQMLIGNLAIGALGHVGGKGWRLLAKGSEKTPDVPPSPAGEQVSNTGDLSPREIPPGNLDNPTSNPHNDTSHGPPKPIPLDDALRFLEEGLDPRRAQGGNGAYTPAGRGRSADTTGNGPRRNAPAKLRDYASHGHPPISEGWLGTLVPGQGGAEHQTFNDPAEPAWRIKVTRPALRFQDGTPRHLSEAKYLQRLRLGKIVFGDQVEYLGVISTPQGDSIVTRQIEVKALDPDNPYPTEPEIFDWLTRAGFERTPDHWQNWVRKADGLEIEDIHPGNFIQTAHGIRPIDVQLEQTAAAKAAGLRIIPWEETQAGMDFRAQAKGSDQSFTTRSSMNELGFKSEQGGAIRLKDQPEAVHKPNEGNIIRTTEDIPTLVEHYGLSKIVEDYFFQATGEQAPKLSFEFKAVEAEELNKGPGLDMRSGERAFARYGTKYYTNNAPITFNELMDIDGTAGSLIPIRFDKNLLNSDHGLIGVLAHEIWEIMNLQNSFKFQPNKTMTGAYLHDHLIGPNGMLHRQAWGVHDDVIRLIRHLPQP